MALTKKTVLNVDNGSEWSIISSGQSFKKGLSTQQKSVFPECHSEVWGLGLLCGTLHGADPVDVNTWGAMLGGWSLL